MRTGAVVLAAGMAIAAAGGAWAGAYGAGEQALREAYGAYRVALFQTNGGNAEASSQAVATFAGRWQALAGDWRQDPPPQYQDDPALPGTLARVDALIATAGEEVADGKLAAAHETLEGVRDQIAGLHARAGIAGFSDRMNAYHARMEQILATDYAALGAAGLAQLRADAAVLAYLADRIVAEPAPEAAEPGYPALVAGVVASVAALQAAAEAGDPAAIAAARGGLKKPYSQLFLKFG